MALVDTSAAPSAAHASAGATISCEAPLAACVVFCCGIIWEPLIRPQFPSCPPSTQSTLLQSLLRKHPCTVEMVCFNHVMDGIVCTLKKQVATDAAVAASAAAAALLGWPSVFTARE
jgi:hypothetical protein